MIRFICNTRI